MAFNRKAVKINFLSQGRPDHSHISLRLHNPETQCPKPYLSFKHKQEGTRANSSMLTLRIKGPSPPNSSHFLDVTLVFQREREIGVKVGLKDLPDFNSTNHSGSNQGILMSLNYCRLNQSQSLSYTEQKLHPCLKVYRWNEEEKRSRILKR